jgi:hypothetical protein
MTVEQRKMIAEGADVLIEIVHFGGPLAPSRVMLLNQYIESESDPDSKMRMAEWFRAQTRGPYGI